MEYPSLDTPKAGAFRFNTDIKQLELYDGGQWVGLVSYLTPELQTGGTRGLVAGGGQPAKINIISYANISTTGDFADFGDLTQSVSSTTGLASRTRGVRAGGSAPSNTDTMDYVTISSTGNAIDFGNQDTNRGQQGGCANDTRGLIGGGTDGSNPQNVINYITIATTGNTVDFGDLKQQREQMNMACASPIRGFWTGGEYPSGSPDTDLQMDNTIQYVNIASTGTAAEFIDVFGVGTYAAANGCNGVIGVRAGGAIPSEDSPRGAGSRYAAMWSWNVASLGVGHHFGDMVLGRAQAAGLASSTRFVIAGGQGTPNGDTALSSAEYIEFATLGDAVDFGDLPQVMRTPASFTNGHGGL